MPFIAIVVFSKIADAITEKIIIRILDICEVSKFAAYFKTELNEKINRETSVTIEITSIAPLSFSFVGLLVFVIGTIFPINFPTQKVG